MDTYKEHSLASLFPMMPENEIKELAADIKQNGLRAPIYLLDNKILDGRNRYKACRIAGVEPKFRDFNGNGDPLTFVISANVHRRHLTESQRAIIAAEISNLKHGQKKSDAQICASGVTSQTDAARQLNVSRRSVQQAKKVIAEAPKEEVEKIKSGEKTVNAVAKELKEKSEKPKEQKSKEPLDKTGYPIPSEILEDWQQAESFSTTLGELHRIKLKVEKGVTESDLLFREVTNTTVADLKNAWVALQGVLPYAVCPTCNGHNRKKCTVCKGRGYISKFAYERWIPQETKEIREKALKK